MAAFPELAPNNENHMLASASPICEIEYARDHISYRKFDADGRELLKLGAGGTPTKVRGGLVSRWDEKARVARIRSTDKKVVITLS